MSIPGCRWRLVTRCSQLMLLALVITLFGANLDLERVLACGGDPPPPRCGKTFVFTLAVPKTVKNVPNQDISVTFPAYTYLDLVSFPPGSQACPPPPYRLVIETTLSCPGMPPIVTTHPAVDIAPGHGRHAVTVTIPEGEPRKCILTATARVFFVDGMVISRATRKCICIVDCSTKDPELPRLSVEPVVPGTELAMVHPGDQTSHRYLLTNNDPREFFRGFLEVVSTNVSRRPVDESPNAPPFGFGVFGLSDALGDSFPIALREDIGEGCIILPPEPQRIAAPTLQKLIVLGPCESREVEIITRPWGMCANGSCSDVTLTLDGRFTDGTLGLGCASVAVIADSATTDPRYAWPDSGQVATVEIQAAREAALRFEGQPSPTGNAATFDTEILSMSLTGSAPIPIDGRVQSAAFPLQGPAVETPTRGRIGTDFVLSKPVDFLPDSFFDIDVEIVVPAVQKPIMPELVSMRLIPGAPAGFDDVAPLGMGEGILRGPNFEVDSFFDLTYQVSGHAVVEVAGKPVDFELVFVKPVLEPGKSGFVLKSTIATRGGEGGGAGIVGAPARLLGISLRHDFGAFVRPGPQAVCPPSSVKDLVCESNGEEVCLRWRHDPAHCPCERILIRDGQGNVIFQLPGDATKVCIPCDRLPASAGTLCVVCVSADGTESEPVCCDYDCRPCPPLDILDCRVIDGNLVIGWVPLPDNCCDRLIVRHAGTGSILAVLPPTVGSFSIPCAELPAPGGAICVECVDPQGNVLARDCCEYDCPTICPPLNLDCSFDGQTLSLFWTPQPQECCTRFLVYHEDDPSVILATLPPTSSGFSIDCADILAATGKAAGRICVDCLTPDGVRRPIGCCEYACDDPCPPVNFDCAFDGETLQIFWNPLPDACCLEYVVYDPADPANILLTLPVGTTSFTAPCERLIDLTGKTSGTICIDCVSPDGSRKRIACCDWSCQVVCPPPNPDCAFDGANLGIFWSAQPPECCTRFLVYHRDDPANIIATLAPSETSFQASCEELFALTGKSSGQICVDCVRPDGTRVNMVCCDYECPEPCPPLQIERCEVVGGILNLTWTQQGNCCDLFRIRVDGVDIASLPPGATSFSIPCDELPNQSGTICVVCIGPDGEKEACCDYECREPCPPLELLRCEVIGGNVLVAWSPVPARCCERIIIRDGNGNDVAVLPPTETMFMIPCSEVTGNVLCVVCVAPDGSETMVCCDFDCPTDCPPFEVVCDPIGNQGLAIAWPAMPPECCERIVLRDANGNDLLVLPANATFLTLDCDRLADLTGSLAGTICVVCIAPDGSEVEGCCEFDCREAPGQLPGDCNQDRTVDISDARCLLGHLFLGMPRDLPCGNGTIVAGGNIRLTDWNGDGVINLADAIALLSYLFLGGRPHANGLECIVIPTCPDVCDP